MRTITFIPVLLIAACVSAPSLSESEAQTIGVEARTLLASATDSTVPSDSWPQAIATLMPKSVRVAPEGLYIETSSQFSEAAGLFGPRNPDGFNPVSGGDPDYKRIHGIVFSYRIRG